MSTQYNNKPLYQYQDNCIFYQDHWKVDNCVFVGTGEKNTGLIWSKINTECPGDIGLNWRYVDYSGPFDGGPVDKSIVIDCKPSSPGSNLTGPVYLAIINTAFCSCFFSALVTFHPFFWDTAEKDLLVALIFYNIRRIM